MSAQPLSRRLLLSLLSGAAGVLLVPLSQGRHAPAPPLRKQLTNSLGMKLVLIPRGKFMMGSPPDEKERETLEEQHEVQISKSFYLGVYEVTQAEYQKVMGSNPSFFSATGGGKAKVAGLDTSRFPVESVSWENAVTFCAKLSALPAERVAGRVYRLPTEAEWEYACRAGTTTPFNHGSSLSPTQVNFDGNYPYGGAAKGRYLERPVPVDEPGFRPNGFGLYHMHGNVWEWTADWYGENYYRDSPKIDPKGPASGTRHVLRGGSWFNYGFNCRAAYRSGDKAGDRFPKSVGLRVVCVSAGRTP
jgi:formylglycine-generating enzyme required for sulfatase activity